MFSVECAILKGYRGGFYIGPRFSVGVAFVLGCAREMKADTGRKEGHL